MSTVFALWHGGASYAHSYAPEDVEVFPSLQEVKDELVARYCGWATIRHLDGTTEVTQTPAVEHDSAFTVWRGGDGGEVPASVTRVCFGPRGGIRSEVY
jgi:hypothetical protein